jgi:hypothetical protein
MKIIKKSLKCIWIYNILFCSAISAFAFVSCRFIIFVCKAEGCNSNSNRDLRILIHLIYLYLFVFDWVCMSGGLGERSPMWAELTLFLCRSWGIPFLQDSPASCLKQWFPKGEKLNNLRWRNKLFSEYSVPRRHASRWPGPKTIHLWKSWRKQQKVENENFQKVSIPQKCRH